MDQGRPAERKAGSAVRFRYDDPFASVLPK